MATLRKSRILSTVSKETPESTRSGRAQSTLDPDLTQDYISQVSKEIEGRVTKKLWKEFSRTEFRILGALLKLDEFHLNPQVWTFSEAVPGTSRNNTSENRETNGDRSSDDPCPEVGYFSHQSGHLSNPEAKNIRHNRIQNAFLTAIDNIVAPKIESAIRSINASSGRDVTSVSANSERRKHVGLNTSFENASENSNVHNGNDETRNNILSEESELSVPETRFERQTQTHHTAYDMKRKIEYNFDQKLFPVEFWILKHSETKCYEFLRTDEMKKNFNKN